MKKLILLGAIVGLGAACGGFRSDELTFNTSTEDVEGTTAAELGVAPADPVTGAPPRPTTGYNGARPARTTIEPQAALSCVSKTTAACTTGSGGLGAACGASAPCNTDLTCVAGVCKPPSSIGGACALNVDCAPQMGTALVCIQGTCRMKSPDSGPCDEALDCAGSTEGPSACVANVCRAQGDIGASCQSPLHCKATSSTGQPLTCVIPVGSVVGVCQGLSGHGGPCADEAQCDQAVAPRCLPTTPQRTCSPPMNENGGACDDKNDCSQSFEGMECISMTCRWKGSIGTSCTLNSQCSNGAVCIRGTCNFQSSTGGACDESADCTQTEPQGCLGGVCQLSGVLDGPCGASNFCGSNSACNTTSNPSGVLFCIGGTCKCPATGTCFDNSNCGTTTDGRQMVCVPRVAPEVGKWCQPVNTSTGGCCDEKADCRPIGMSACLASANVLGCNSGGQCVAGKSQGQQCTSTEECSGSLICKINTLVAGRTYTTCEN